MEADVHLDQHVERSAPRVTAQRRPRPRHRRIVDDERQRDAIGQREHAIGVDRVERIGQPDVGDARVGEHLGLAELGAADADRAALDLHPRDLRRLVGLGVRPQPHAARVGRRLHPIDVPLEPRRVDEYRWCWKFGDSHWSGAPGRRAALKPIPETRVAAGCRSREDLRRLSVTPRWPLTTSANTLRKSVVTARSRPSYRCSRASPGHRP